MGGIDTFELLGKLALDPSKAENVLKVFELLSLVSELPEETIKSITNDNTLTFAEAAVDLLEYAKAKSEIKTKDAAIEAMKTASELSVGKEKALAEVLEMNLSQGKEKKAGAINAMNDSPVTKGLLKAADGKPYKPKTFALSRRTDGEPATVRLLEGYINGYELGILNCIAKFKHEGRITESGKIYFTLGQLYRALRHGDDQSPTNEQKQELLERLREMSEDRRKINFAIDGNRPLFEEFEIFGGRVRIVSFDELFGRKINGQEVDVFIICDNTPVLCKMAEEFKVQEIIPQDLKSIKEKLYKVTLSNGETMTGNSRKVKEITAKNKVEKVEFEKYRKWKMSENRIALREVVFSFVWQCRRAVYGKKLVSFQKNYADIFSDPSIGVKTNKDRARRIEDIADIMDYLKEKNIILDWQEYSNAGSSRMDGIKIFLTEQQMIEG